MSTSTQPFSGWQLALVQGPEPVQTAGLPGWQLPLLHVSPAVHALLSEHCSALLVCVQPVAASQLSSVQNSLSSQGSGWPAEQTPLPQASPPVHASPSSQGPLLSVCRQPLCGAQLSVVHALPSSQLSAAPEVQVPLLQPSSPLHASPSKQGVPASNPAPPGRQANRTFPTHCASLHTAPTHWPATHAPAPQSFALTQATQMPWSRSHTAGHCLLLLHAVAT